MVIFKKTQRNRSEKGSEKLLQFINQYKLTPDNPVVDIEALATTGYPFSHFFINLD